MQNASIENVEDLHPNEDVEYDSGVMSPLLTPPVADEGTALICASVAAVLPLSGDVAVGHELDLAWNVADVRISFVSFEPFM